MSHHSSEMPEELRRQFEKEMQDRLKDPENVRQFQQEKLGATGNFPDGKIGEADEGEIMLRVAGDPERNLVHIDFGTPVHWMAMTPQQAIGVAQLLIQHARAVAKEPVTVTLH